jgi:hypothetical protein
MKIAFHDNAMSLFGTTLALYNWAYWGRKYLDIEPIIMYNSNHIANNNLVINKFKNTFDNMVFSYSNQNQIDNILSKNQCEYFFMEKGGKPDGVLSTVSKNLINAIAICDMNDIHGDIFAMGSEWLSKIVDYKIPFVPYIVTLPEHTTNMRSELGIPKDAFVFGRNGGYETFNIQFVKEAIKEVLQKRTDIWFIFQCTEKFIDHERVIYIQNSPDSEYKVSFINSCDAMLHAREVGESFGMACGEFSIKNKPIVTWFGSRERSHIDILGDNGIYYNDKNEITDILLHISKNDINNKDWNMYRCFDPKTVMDQFKQVYLK